MSLTADAKSVSFTVSVVVPALNEEGNIRPLYERLHPILSRFPHYELIFVDDGSSDNTLQALKELVRRVPAVRYLSFSRNFGHQQAVKAGLDHARGNCVICMDCDLQHPPELIPTMVDKWREGFEVVYTIREEDPHQSFAKRFTSRWFYRLVNKLSDVRIEPAAADFRLLDRRVVEALRPMTEKTLFLRGLIPWLGFRQVALPYMPNDRVWGQTKYSFSRMFRLAADGLASFSVKPLYVTTVIGALVSGAAFLYALYALGIKIFTTQAIEGWTSVLVSVLFLGGIQLLMIGILGEYLGRLFLESKPRPPYVIRETSDE